MLTHLIECIIIEDNITPFAMPHLMPSLGHTYSCSMMSWVKSFSFSGIHVIHPGIFKYMPAEGTFSIVDVYLNIAKDKLVIAYDHTGDLVLDVGKPDALIKAAEIFK